MSTRRWFYSVNRPSQIEVVSVYVGDVGNVKTNYFNPVLFHFMSQLFFFIVPLDLILGVLLVT